MAVTSSFMSSGMFKELALGTMGRGGTWFGRTVFESGAFLKSSPDQPIPDIQFHTLPWGYPDPNQDGPRSPALTLQRKMAS